MIEEGEVVSVSFKEAYFTGDNSTVDATVSLDKAPGREVVIPITATPLGVTTTDDYTVDDSVAFGASQTSRDITFTATDDMLDEDNESVMLNSGRCRWPCTLIQRPPPPSSSSTTTGRW